MKNKLLSIQNKFTPQLIARSPFTIIQNNQDFVFHSNPKIDQHLESTIKNNIPHFELSQQELALFDLKINDNEPQDFSDLWRETEEQKNTFHLNFNQNYQEKQLNEQNQYKIQIINSFFYKLEIYETEQLLIQAKINGETIQFLQNNKIIGTGQLKKQKQDHICVIWSNKNEKEGEIFNEDDYIGDSCYCKSTLLTKSNNYEMKIKFANGLLTACISKNQVQSSPCNCRLQNSNGDCIFQLGALSNKKYYLKKGHQISLLLAFALAISRMYYIYVL